jgi:hypothetical protein
MLHRLAIAPVLVLVLLAGCSSPRPAPREPSGAAAIAPSEFASLPIASEAAIARERDQLPLSIKRLVSEQQSEMKDVIGLAGPVGDERGRARAAREVSVLADELRSIEAGLRTGSVDSNRLDEIVVKLQLLQTRIALLHDALRVASGPATAVQID